MVNIIDSCSCEIYGKYGYNITLKVNLRKEYFNCLLLLSKCKQEVEEASVGIDIRNGIDIEGFLSPPRVNLTIISRARYIFLLILMLSCVRPSIRPSVRR